MEDVGAAPRIEVMSRDGFSIGDTAAIVGVSTHVLRSWERRLSLNLHHRTRANQRRYRLEDIQRFITIRRLHEASGLPLVESAAKALGAGEAPPPASAVGHEPAELESYWAALSDTLPEVLIVIDAAGKIVAANEAARTSLNVHGGMSFARLAPGGWRKTYRALCRDAGAKRTPVPMAMRARSGIVFLDATVVPIGRVPGGPVALIGTRLRGQSPAPRSGLGFVSRHV
jgi:DNA-binding transcriptional MerR regulator